MSWTKEEDRKLKELCESGKYFFKDMAPKLKKLPGATVYRAKKLGLKNVRDGRERKGIHNHLTETVMTYFLDHTYDECCKKFGLTSSNMKSLFSLGYKIEKLRHLRKDTRMKSAWTLKTRLNFLRKAGLMQREEIAISEGRGQSSDVIKEFMRKMGAGETRYLNGLSSKWFFELTGVHPTFFIQTRSGPAFCQHKIVPWVWISGNLKVYELIPEELRPCIDAMSKFQKFIYQENEVVKICLEMREIVDARDARDAKKNQ